MAHFFKKKLTSQVDIGSDTNFSMRKLVSMPILHLGHYRVYYLGKRLQVLHLCSLPIILNTYLL